MYKTCLLKQITLFMLTSLCLVSLVAGVSALSDGSPGDAVTLKQDVVVHEDTSRTLPVKEMSSEVGSIPPGILDPRIREGLNASALGTPPEEIGSSAGSESYVFVTKWGSAPLEDGQFNGPCDVAVDSSGNVYVADYGNHRI